MTKAHEDKIHQIREESVLAAERQQAELRNQHSANMEGLRNEHRRMEAQRNAEIEKLRREQASLNQQFANANQKLQELKNRPGNSIKALSHTVLQSPDMKTLVLYQNIIAHVILKYDCIHSSVRLPSTLAKS